jgi:ribonuclease HII
MANKTLPTFLHEQNHWDTGKEYIAGIDEVGRGCFAGPVVAAAVIFPKYHTFSNFLLHSIDDSKKVSAKKRGALATAIYEEAVAVSIAEIPVTTINDMGVGKATQQAFTRAVVQLSQEPDFVLIDAFRVEGYPTHQQQAIIHGDSLSISIAAASIVAKVYRDNLMTQLDLLYPAYDFKTNKGYGTLAHRNALQKIGLCDIHRTSFSLDKFLSPQI